MNRPAETSPEHALSALLTAAGIAFDPALLRQGCTLLQEIVPAGDPAPVKEVMETAELLVSEFSLDADPVMALLILPAFSAGRITKEEITRGFGSGIADIVTALVRISRLDTTQFRANAENFIKLLLTLSPDIRVVLISLARKVREMRNIFTFPTERQTLIAAECALIYTPIAHRIGLYRIKTELEDRVMRFDEPETWVLLHQKLAESQEGREQYTTEFIRPIEDRLHENGFDVEIRSRIKSIPSIRRKMQMQKVGFDRIYDIFAIRIIINRPVEDEKADCWKVYSLVTDIYTPNPRRLRDWISFPKSTGYESLHATVIGPAGKWVEVQIRTRRMDEVAEKGLAAHWKYKSGGEQQDAAGLYATLRERLEKPLAARPAKTVTKEKRALYTDEIFIFTPKGDLKRLRSGYSVLDFAFEIHTDVGSTCTGAIVNGKIVPLKHTLQNGDTVKILTSRTQRPHHGWLDIVKSPRTQARIRHALKMESYKESEAGKEIIRNKMAQIGADFSDVNLTRLADFFSCDTILDLYQGFGEGKLDPLKIKKAMADPAPAPTQAGTPRTENIPEQVSEVMKGRQDYLVIEKGLQSIHYQFARCCNPMPGDKIFAFVGVSQGIRIHQTACPNARQLITRYPYRILEARWKELPAVDPKHAGERTPRK